MSKPDDESCPIWPDFEVDTVAFPAGQDMREVTGSPRAGGDYQLKDGVLSTLRYRQRQPEGPRIMARLTTLLIAKRDAGDRRPEITRGLVNEAENASDLPAHVRADRLLQCIEYWTDTLGEEVDAYQDPDIYGELLAWSESLDEAELRFLEHYLRSKGWLQSSSKLPVVSVKGYARIAELTAANTDSMQAFVAMWLDDSMDALYKDAIEPAIKAAGYAPFRVDQSDSLDRLEDQVIAEIRRSKFIVADVSHDAQGARGSVYWEAGFAYGLNIPIIYTARKGIEPHFDVSHFPHIFWKDAADLRVRLEERIRAAAGIRPGPTPRDNGSRRSRTRLGR